MDVKSVIEIMRKEPNDITIKELAERFNYSESYFSRAFKKETGVSPQEYLSAVRLENSIESILTTEDKIIKTQLQNGYLSEGTFSRIIKHAMILSPKQLQKERLNIFDNYRRLNNFETIVESHKSVDLTIQIKCEEVFNGIVFIGLFKHPIPNHPPIIGKVLSPKNINDPVIFSDVPTGTYYCLSCVIHPTSNPVKLFIHKDNLRGKIDEPLVFPGKHTKVLHLRRPVETDPPITLNLPLMLVNMIKDKKTEHRSD